MCRHGRALPARNQQSSILTLSIPIFKKKKQYFFCCAKEHYIFKAGNGSGLFRDDNLQLQINNCILLLGRNARIQTISFDKTIQSALSNCSFCLLFSDAGPSDWMHDMETRSGQERKAGHPDRRRPQVSTRLKLARERGHGEMSDLHFQRGGRNLS